MFEYLIKIQTLQSKVIKILFEVLKDVLPGTVNLIFTKDGLTLKMFSSNEKSILHLDLPSEKFEEFYCDTDIFLAGIDTNNLYKITKSIQNRDLLEFFVYKDDKQTINISKINLDTNLIYNHKIKLFSVPYCNLDIPNISFDHELVLKSTEFQTICKNLNSLMCTDVDIHFTIDSLVITSNNDYSINEITIKQQQDIDLVKYIPECLKDNGKKFQGKYILQYLLLFTKATSLDKNFTIHLNSTALNISYSVGQLGTLTFMLIPE